MSTNKPFRMKNVVRVHELPLLADVGINPEEVGCRQPLVISVELELIADEINGIHQTVDYRRVAKAAEDLALAHIPLIETFGQQLAKHCLDMKGVTCARVQIDKPFALTRGQAGVEVVLSNV